MLSYLSCQLYYYDYQCHDNWFPIMSVSKQSLAMQPYNYLPDRDCPAPGSTAAYSVAFARSYTALVYGEGPGDSLASPSRSGRPIFLCGGGSGNYFPFRK